MNDLKATSAQPKRIIGIDFDDVIYNLSGDLLEFFNKRFNTTFKRDDIKQYQLGVMWNIDSEQEEDIIREFCQSELHHGILPVRGAIEAINELSKDNTLMVVTAREEMHTEATNKWLDLHLPNIFDSVVFTNSHHADASRRRKKSEICREYKIEIFIDDSLSNVLDVGQAVSQVFLLDAPWNQHDDLPSNVMRVFSWS